MVELLGAWIVANVLFLIFLTGSIGDGVNCSFVNPVVIYNNIKVNWFGAVLLAIVCNIGLPVAAIPYWIYKLCTIGIK